MRGTPGGKQLKIGSLKSVFGLELRYTELAALNFASPQGVIGEIADPKSRLMGECDGSRSRIQSPDKSGAGAADSVFAIPCWLAVWANRKGEKASVADRERIKPMKQLRIAESLLVSFRFT